jgi:uncharacterized hydrophobic protein (TIGR00271 family)
MSNIDSLHNAHTILVPIANPATASALLELACRLVNPEHGRVIGLFVSRGEAETESGQVAAFSPMVDELRSQGFPVTLITRIAANVTRGILDVAREEKADLLVLGVRHRGREHVSPTRMLEMVTALFSVRARKQTQPQVSLGSLVEEIAAVAPCDLLIYRGADEHRFARIVVPVDGSPNARTACQMAISLGKGYKTPVEVLHVQESSRPTWEGRGRIEQSLIDLPGSQTVKRTVVTAREPAIGVLSRIDEDDLLLIGVSEQSRLDRWLYGDFLGRVLEGAPGPVILIRRSIPDVRLAGRFSRWLKRFDVTLTRPEQEELLWQAEEMASPHLDYMILVILSAALASLGLLLDSAAVIIGAMLVAPLMQPLIGLAVGTAISRIRLAGRAWVTLSQGVLIALLVSIGVGVLAAPGSPTAEMVARGNPGWLDVGVALASGFVGAYATARKDIPGALAGVAIAAALMPPLCTAGLSLGAGDTGLGVRAGLLFLMNIACITLAACGVFLWLGLRRRHSTDSEGTK